MEPCQGLRLENQLIYIKKTIRPDFLREILFAFESFQTEDKDLRCFIDLHLLLGQHEVLTLWAEPFIVFSKNFFLLEVLQALQDAYARRFRTDSSCVFHVVVLFIQLIEHFFNFFLIFSPVKFHFNAFIPGEFTFRVIANIFSEKSLVIR